MVQISISPANRGQWTSPGCPRASTNSSWMIWRKPSIWERLPSRYRRPLKERESSPANVRVVVGLCRTWVLWRKSSGSAERGQSCSYAASSSRSGFFLGRSLSETKNRFADLQKGSKVGYRGVHCEMTYHRAGRRSGQHKEAVWCRVTAEVRGEFKTKTKHVREQTWFLLCGLRDFWQLVGGNLGKLDVSLREFRRRRSETTQDPLSHWCRVSFSFKYTTELLNKIWILESKRGNIISMDTD